MLSCNVRGNWRDLLLMTRTSTAVNNAEDNSVVERSPDRHTGSAMTDAPESFPLRLALALPAGLGR